MSHYATSPQDKALVREFYRNMFVAELKYAIGHNVWKSGGTISYSESAETYIAKHNAKMQFTEEELAFLREEE